VFVRGIPFDFTDAQLEAIFENVGPIKEGFVVAKKDGGVGNRGFGFVQFATAPDAEEAVSQFHNTEVLP
jgi:nucleolar protein 4